MVEVMSVMIMWLGTTFMLKSYVFINLFIQAAHIVQWDALLSNFNHRALVDIGSLHLAYGWKQGLFHK